MKYELVERYIYAVTKGMKKGTKEDVAKELESIIEDMLEERCGNDTPTDKDIRHVLTNLGTPGELAAKYDADNDKCLIGAPYYHQYKYIVRIVMICVVCGVSIGQVVSLITDPVSGMEIWRTFGTWISSVITSALSGFAIVTLIFAVFYQRGIKMDTLYDTIDNLPAVPQKKNKISKAECIFGIVISVLFMTVFLAFPNIIAAYFSKPAKIVPLFNAEVVRSTWYLILIMGAVGIVNECIKLVEGKYSKKVMWATIIADFLSFFLMVIWFSTKDLLNMELVNHITKVIGNGDIVIPNLQLGAMNLFVGFIGIALLIDIITTVVSTLKQN